MPLFKKVSTTKVWPDLSGLTVEELSKKNAEIQAERVRLTHISNERDLTGLEDEAMTVADCISMDIKAQLERRKQS